MDVNEAREIVGNATVDHLRLAASPDGYVPYLLPALATLVLHGRRQRTFERTAAMAEGKGGEWAERSDAGAKIVGEVVKADAPLLRALAGQPYDAGEGGTDG